MDRKWTNEQRDVISHKDGDLTVSAAAGSGKTTVMVERVLRLVREEHYDLNRMLIVTFTRAAAGEMRQKIAGALDEALKAEPGNGFLRRQRQALQDAPIGTLHGFCGDLLRNYGAALGLDPDFSVCDDTRKAILWKAAKQEALERAFAAPSEGFSLLARGWSRYSDNGLEKLCDAVQAAYAASPLGVRWVRDAAERYKAGSEDPFRSRWAEVIMRDAADTLEDAAEKLDRAFRLLDGFGGPEGCRPILENDRAQVGELLSAEGPVELTERLGALQYPRWAGVDKKKDDPVLAGEVQRLRTEARKEVTDLAKAFRPIFTQRDVAADTGRMVPAMFALADLMEDCEAEFTRRKTARNCLDFNDLEHKVLELLEDGPTREEISERFLSVFVDEYQDTNAVQEAILMKIVRPGTFFCVGDAKQAIYRFRQADPTLFLERYEKSSDDPEAPMRRIDLSSNFRSHPGILRFVNAVFSRSMTKELGGLTYDRAAALEPGLNHPDPDRTSVKIDILAGSGSSDDEDELEDMSDLEAEALRAAWHIRRRMGEPVYDGERYRPAQYRDFAILMERAAYEAETVAQVLRSCGIPCVAQNDSDWLSQPETLLILSALRWLDNGDRAEELMTLLHSPFGGFSLEELLEIRRGAPDLEFPRAVRRAAEKDDPLGRRLASFLEEWDGLRDRVPYMDVETLIWEIANRKAWYLILGGRPGGKEAQRRVRMLAEQARSLADSRERTLYAFLRFTDSMADARPGEASGSGVGEEDAVWITTIHKSKGLEYPVVILLRAGRAFRRENTGENLFFHDRLGLGPRAILEESHWTVTTLAREAVLCLNRQENRSERLRLLYVALTRPKEELIVIASVGKDPGKALTRWSRDETAWDRAHARCLMDWIGPVVVRHPSFASYAGADPVPADYGLEVSWLPETERMPGVTPPVPEEDGEGSAAFLEGFGYVYPYTQSVDLPSKIAVTALLEGYTTKRGDEPDGYIPEPETSGDPRRAGTLTHSALQYLRDGMDEAAVRSKLEELRERGVFSKEDLKLIRVPWLARFCAGDLARRIGRSARVLREQPFNLFVPADEVYPEKSGCTDPLMIQGVIDLAFLEDGAWVLVDYKTNRIPPEGPEALLEHYGPQLKLYSLALRRITEIPVKAAGLALLSSGETVWMKEEER